MSSEDVESEPDVAQPSIDGESDEICLMASADHTESNDDTGDEDVTIVATQDGNVVQCSTQVHDYCFCSLVLSHLSVWEFVSKVDKVKRPSASRNANDNVYVGDCMESSEDDDIYCNNGNDDSDNIELLDEGKGGLQDQHSPQNIRSGRKSQTFPLHTEHMQSNRKAQRLWRDPTNYFIPVPIGPAFPHCDRAESFPKYCRPMLVMFKPWCVVGDLQTPGQMWVNAFDEFMEACDNSIRVVLDNMQVLHKCCDAKDVEDQRRRDVHHDNI